MIELKQPKVFLAVAGGALLAKLLHPTLVRILVRKCSLCGEQISIFKWNHDAGSSMSVLSSDFTFIK